MPCVYSLICYCYCKRDNVDVNHVSVLSYYLVNNKICLKQMKLFVSKGKLKVENLHMANHSMGMFIIIKFP